MKRFFFRLAVLVAFFYPFESFQDRFLLLHAILITFNSLKYFFFILEKRQGFSPSHFLTSYSLSYSIRHQSCCISKTGNSLGRNARFQSCNTGWLDLDRVDIASSVSPSQRASQLAGNAHKKNAYYILQYQVVWHCS